MPTKMQLQTIRGHVRALKPLLDRNLHETHRGYMDGRFAAGAWHYALARHGTVSIVLTPSEAIDKADIVEVYDACAALTIDARDAIGDIKTPSRKAVAQRKLDALVAHLKECGYVNTVCGVPARPRAQRELLRA